MADSARIEDLRKRYHENPRRFFAPLANEYRKSGFLDRALLLCEKHLAEQPENMNGLVVYGQTLFEAGRQDDAREPFERALKLDPENLIALRQLGDIARIGGDVPTAQSWYRKVLEFDRRNDEVLELLEQMGVGESKEAPSAPRPSSTSIPLISVAPTVSVSGGDALDIGMVELDAPKAPVAGPGKTKVINAQRLADEDRPATPAVAATPVPAAAPKARKSLLDISFDFSDVPEMPSAKPPVPAAPLMGAEAAEYGFADIAPEVPSAPSVSAPSAAAPIFSAPIVDETPTALPPLDEGVDGLELAEFSSDVSPLAGLEAAEFVSEDVAPLADLDLPEVDVEDVAPLAGLDRPDVEVEDVAPLAGLEMAAGIPLLGDTPTEPPMAIPPMSIADVPSLADTLPINTPMLSPWRESPSQEPPLEPSTAPSSSPRPRMTRADLASLPLLADFGLEDDEPARTPTPLATPAVPAVSEPRGSQKAPSFVTETMATLYLQQGFRDKAIDVYRQLVEQSPEDTGLRSKLAELVAAEEAVNAADLGAQEMPEFDSPSAGSAEPEPAPANDFLADVSFAEVGLATPRPSSSRTPLATPAVATGPTAREFFSAFARRGLAAAATVAATVASVSAAEVVAAVPAELAVAESPSASTEAPTGWPLDTLFGAPTEVRDLHAAEVLAGVATFAGPTGGTGLEQLFAEPASAPSGGRRTVARASQMLKFDQFFSPQAAADAESPSLPSTPPAAPTEPGDDDLDQFHGWLQALKP